MRKKIEKVTIQSHSYHGTVVGNIDCTKMTQMKVIKSTFLLSHWTGLHLSEIRFFFLSCWKLCPSVKIHIWSQDCTSLCTLYNIADDTLSQASLTQFRNSCNVNLRLMYPEDTVGHSIPWAPTLYKIVQMQLFVMKQCSLISLVLLWRWTSAYASVCTRCSISLGLPGQDLYVILPVSLNSFSVFSMNCLEECGPPGQHRRCNPSATLACSPHSSYIMTISLHSLVENVDIITSFHMQTLQNSSSYTYVSRGSMSVIFICKISIFMQSAYQMSVEWNN